MATMASAASRNQKQQQRRTHLPLRLLPPDPSFLQAVVVVPSKRMADCSNACLFEAAVASGGGVERQVGDACGRDGGPAGPQVSETREASASGWACTRVDKVDWSFGGALES
ncbi:hypothetical protein SETIT_5G278600v2 [Setaria italica]|uniref:Uncharacterized protein n=2 Tax=Setaria TaxID=4554 RepID=A0A368R9P8_SETIT|nr:hypothetical protein SETIT_5G278600v2 [Setaria italica]TKW16163.1 hypothetical protein SEVIR_5G281150v2 [Setaria viridis]